MPCGGLAVLEEAARSAETAAKRLEDPGERGGMESVLAALRQVLATHSSPSPAFRSLEEFEAAGPAAVAYRDLERAEFDEGVKVSRALSAVNCHDGQRKLALTLLDFLNLAGAREGDHLVYVGASSYAAHVARAAYPAVRQTIFDPDPNLESLMPAGYRKAAVFAEKSGELSGLADPDLVAVKDLFGDEAAGSRLHGRLGPGERVLFVSDVRTESDEVSIRRDMVNQQAWAVRMGAAWFMFKFRLPYDSDLAAATAQYRAAAEGLGLGLEAPAGPGSFPYLQGSLRLQPFPPARSGELRLVGEGLRLAEYDVERTEALVNTFNVLWRAHALFQGAPGTPGSRPYDAAASELIMRAVPDRTRAAAQRALDGARRRPDADRCGLATLRKGVGSGWQLGRLGPLLEKSCGARASRPAPPLPQARSRQRAPRANKPRGRRRRGDGAKVARSRGGSGGGAWRSSAAALLCVAVSSLAATLLRL